VVRTGNRRRSLVIAIDLYVSFTAIYTRARAPASHTSRILPLAVQANMSEEPLFDPSLKKRSKKKQVAFSEDPLGAEADPTVPAPDTLESTTATGEDVDLGPKTVHEQMKQSGEDEKVGGKDEDEELKAMFGDLKKKKKKEIPLDLVRPSSLYLFTVIL
jgi:hypothetical protein